MFVDRSPAFLTSDDFIRSNEIIRIKWPIFVVIGHFVQRIKYEVSTHKIMQDSTNTRDLDKKSVGMPGTQPACVGKFSVVVLILLFTF